jgi:hypothetical protein
MLCILLRFVSNNFRFPEFMVIEDSAMLTTLVAGPSGRAVCGRSLAGFVGSNPTGKQEYQSLVNVVCCLCRTDRSFRELLPTVVRRCVWSRNLINEEDMARVLPQTHVKRTLPCFDNICSSHGDYILCHIISDDILCKDAFIFHCFGDCFCLYNTCCIFAHQNPAETYWGIFSSLV